MDKYSSLKESPFSVSEIKYCNCDSQFVSLGAVVHLLPNSLRCLSCFEAVDPANIPMLENVVSSLSNWSLTLATFRWLAFFDESGYEEWSDSELSNINSLINQKGLKIHKEINLNSKVYYWFSRKYKD
mgnify:FL=1